MILIQVKVEPPKLCKATCNVRFWVEPFEASSSETEIEMIPSERHVWIGHAPLRAIGTAREFLYRLALSTSADTFWSLSLINHEDGRVLLTDSDSVAASKTWLVGTCSAMRIAESERVQPALVPALLRRSATVIAMPRRRPH